jgi:hypothetical protein
MTTFMIKMTQRINLIIIIKVVDLDNNHNYSYNHKLEWTRFFLLSFNMFCLDKD